ncbi:MAG: right-handed parallel beta-helix repeat-containing protein, partial [bacterium]
MPLSTGQAFYVSSSSGSDANPGTITAPWRTLQKAFDALQPGQIAYLRAGTYGAFCSASRFSRAGTPAAPITVQGYPGESAVVHGQIRLEGSYFRLAHVIVEGPSCGPWGATTRQGENLVQLFSGITHHVEVSNSEVYHSGWHAGINAGGDDIWILNNYIHDNGGFNDPDQYNTSHGIYYSDGSRGVVANNILEHNRAKGLSSRYSANHIIVANNTVVGNGRSGMDITENTHDWIFANNVVANNGNVNDGVGIHTSGSSGGASHIEINNILWNNGVSGTSNWDTNATIINNRVADPLLVSPVSSVPSTTH